MARTPPVSVCLDEARDSLLAGAFCRGMDDLLAVCARVWMVAWRRGRLPFPTISREEGGRALVVDGIQV